MEYISGLVFVAVWIICGIAGLGIDCHERIKTTDTRLARADLKLLTSLALLLGPLVLAAAVGNRSHQIGWVWPWSRSTREGLGIYDA